MTEIPEERKKIVALARSFPSLAAMARHWPILSPAGWDVDAFMKAVHGWSKGEAHAALFVANVWNPGYARSQKWEFSAIEALSIRDAYHRRAFIEWASHPYWP